METKEKQTEIIEKEGKIYAVDKEKITHRLSWTASLTFHVLLRRPDLHALSSRESLILAVKDYAQHLGFNRDAIKSETISRTWRKMVEDGIIKKDGRSDVAEEANREFWR